MLLRNPYTNRNRILSESDFFGRERELRSTFTRLLGGASVSLVGERRTGKSSILSALSFEGERESLGIPETLRIAYTDCQELVGCDEQQFLEYLCESFAMAMDLTPPLSLDRAAFKKLGVEARNSGLLPVLAMDEFDLLLQNQKISASFLAFLRSWSSGTQVPFVLTSWEGSIRALAESPEAGSNFLNIFAPVYVGPIEREDAEELVATPAQLIGEAFSRADIGFIRRLGGLHPFFLQMASYHLLEARRRGFENELAWSAAEKDFTYDATPHLQFLVSRLSPEERGALSDWLRQRTGVTTGEGYDSLFRKGILVRDPDPRLFSDAFERVFQRAQEASVTHG